MNGYFIVEQVTHLSPEEALHYLKCGCIRGDSAPLVEHLLRQQRKEWLKKYDEQYFEIEELKAEKQKLEERIDELESKE